MLDINSLLVAVKYLVQKNFFLLLSYFSTYLKVYQFLVHCRWYKLMYIYFFEENKHRPTCTSLTPF